MPSHASTYGRRSTESPIHPTHSALVPRRGHPLSGARSGSIRCVRSRRSRQTGGAIAAVGGGEGLTADGEVGFDGGLWEVPFGPTRPALLRAVWDELGGTMHVMSGATRRQNLEAMSQGRLDVLVLGGGITGAGVALDAASRGLRVGLLDRADFASGTSGRSSREIHGGLRYIAKGDVALVRQSLRERRRVARLVPHLIRPLPFFIPTRSIAAHWSAAAGLMAYDALDSRPRVVPGRRRVAPEEASRMTGGLVDGVPGFEFFETVTDDARLTLQVALHAASFGAFLSNYAGVVDFLGSGRVDGVVAIDRFSGENVEVRAKVTVNATGAWAQHVQQLAGEDAIRLRPSKGVHLVFDRETLPIRSGLIIPSIVPGSYQFMIPWGDRVYVGTTDTPFEGELDDPGVEADDAAIILDSIDAALGTKLTGDDTVASWAGVRPLLESRRSATEDISRRHVVAMGPPGLVTVTGGKLTTFLVMAADAVDAALREGDMWAPRRPVSSIGLYGSLDAALVRARSEAARMGLDPDAGDRMVARYGDGWSEALRLVQEDRSMGERLHAELPVLRVEAVMARRFEMAMCDEDIIDRRTRIRSMDHRIADELTLPAEP